jgi:hypothetical protein
MSDEPKPVTPGNPDASALSSEKRMKMWDHILRGAPPAVAAAAAGVSEEEAERIMSDPVFANRIAGAEAGHEAWLLKVISNAAARDWHAAAYLLERRYPERWNREQVDRRGRSVAKVRVRVAVKDESFESASPEGEPEARGARTVAEDEKG